MGGCGFVPQSESYGYLHTVNTLAGDWVRDWYCRLHSQDSSGKFTINDPGMKKVADAVVSFEIINYMLDLFCIFRFT